MHAQDSGPRFGSSTFRSMNTDVTVTLSLPQTRVESLISETVQPVFQRTERACSRFLKGNPLDLVNSLPNDTHTVPEELYRAVKAAYDSYLMTEGLFDPRILTSLQRLGYEESFEMHTPQSGSAQRLRELAPLDEWQPTLRHSSGSFFINLGGRPIDLGGIAKGYTVDMIAEELKKHANSGCVNAGGDIQVWGASPEDQPWRIGVEHPLDTANSEFVAVLELTNIGIATSSSRKRQWRTRENLAVHHIIDPRTGISADNEIRSVTAIHTQTRIAETLTKALFVLGESEIEDAAKHFNAQALWVTAAGNTAMTDQLGSALLWKSQT